MTVKQCIQQLVSIEAPFVLQSSAAGLQQGGFHVDLMAMSDALPPERFREWIELSRLFRYFQRQACS
jgi:hypothetical protein